MNWRDITVAIALIGATVGAVTYFTPVKAFDAKCVEFTKILNDHEARLDGIDVAYLKKRLAQLEVKYGHTRCYQMSETDKTDCEWIKDALARFGGGK